MTDDMCRATTNTGFGVATCYLRAGHTDPHDDGNQTRANVQPLQERGPEQARGNYSSDQLTGIKIDDLILILDLFRRIEQLEQGTASGTATDDMFATTNRKHSHLAQSVGEMHERVTRLEQAAVYGPGPHDLSALQASIQNHVNRAITDLGTGIGEQHDQINGDAQQRNQAMVDRLNAMWDVLTAMAPVIDRLGQVYSREVIVKIGDELVQTERASGSPAAVRCPARFREGQCLGYAGHEGECSALPDPREPQLENPEEFGHTSHASLDYLNRRGVPDEPEKCGNQPAPGSASPPCGRPAGHTGVCVSGPQYSGEDESGDPFAESTYDRTSDGTPIEPGDPFEGDGHGDTSHSV